MILYLPNGGYCHFLLCELLPCWAFIFAALNSLRRDSALSRIPAADPFDFS
ncbi:hypothetical protein LguiB_018060 [Lonicera macranthoides]